VIVELEVIGGLSNAYIPRCRSNLRATGKPPCPPINFGRPKIEIRRVTAPGRSRQPSPSSALK